MEQNKIQPIPYMGEYQTLTYRTNKVKHSDDKIVIMTFLTEKEEIELDNNKTITIKRKDIDGVSHSFTVRPKATYGYGTVDLCDGSDDAELVERFKFLDNLDFGGYPLPVFNYVHNKLLGGWYATWNPLVVCQYAHCKIGKPERIVIFRK